MDVAGAELQRRAEDVVQLHSDLEFVAMRPNDPH
jgi:hypothetical protein